MTSDPSGSEPFSPFPLLLLTQATSRRRLCPFLLNLPALKILQSFSFFLKSSFPQLPEFSTWWGAKARSGWLTLTPRANCSLAPLPAPCSVASHWKLEIGRGGDIYTTEIITPQLPSGLSTTCPAFLAMWPLSRWVFDLSPYCSIHPLMPLGSSSQFYWSLPSGLFWNSMSHKTFINSVELNG